MLSKFIFLVTENNVHINCYDLFNLIDNHVQGRSYKSTQSSVIAERNSNHFSESTLIIQLTLMKQFSEQFIDEKN